MPKGLLDRDRQHATRQRERGEGMPAQPGNALGTEDAASNLEPGAGTLPVQ